MYRELMFNFNSVDVSKQSAILFAVDAVAAEGRSAGTLVPRRDGLDERAGTQDRQVRERSAQIQGKDPRARILQAASRREFVIVSFETFSTKYC